jgi:hypothetical protein
MNRLNGTRIESAALQKWTRQKMSMDVIGIAPRSDVRF